MFQYLLEKNHDQGFINFSNSPQEQSFTITVLDFIDARRKSTVR